jgi:hypothetical protein
MSKWHFKVALWCPKVDKGKLLEKAGHKVMD